MVNMANTTLPGGKPKRKQLTVPTDECDSFVSHMSGFYLFYQPDTEEEFNNEILKPSNNF